MERASRQAKRLTSRTQPSHSSGGAGGHGSPSPIPPAPRSELSFDFVRQSWLTPRLLVSLESGEGAPPSGVPRRTWDVGAGRSAGSPVLTRRSVRDIARGDGGHHHLAPSPHLSSAELEAGGVKKQKQENQLDVGEVPWRQEAPRSPEMRRGLGPLSLALFFFLLNLLARPGDGNQGSIAGSCSCSKRIRSGTLVPPATVDHIRKHLKTYDRCPFFIRFHLTSMIVCGGSQEPWVRELVSCFDRKECGNGHGKSLHLQEHLPHASTRIPVATEGTPPDTSTPATIQSTQQSTLPPGTLSLNNELTHHIGSTALTSGYETTVLTSGYETTALMSGYDPEAGPEAEANKNRSEGSQQEGPPGASAGIPATVPVLSLLAIVFLLAAVMVYMLCNRRRVRRQSSADLQLHYTLVNQDASA